MASDRPIVIYRGKRSQPTMALDVTEFGRHSTASHIQGRRLPTYAIVFVERGTGQLTTTAAGTLDVVAPALFWLTPGMAHGYGPAPGTSWSERWALFEGSLAAEFETLGLIDPARGRIALKNATEIARLFGTLHAQMLGYGQVDRSAAAATVYAIVAAAAGQATAGDRASPKIARAIEALKQRAFTEIDITTLCGEFGVSPATLRRHAIWAYGMPPKVLQARLRLDRAKELLAASDDGIEAIAAAVGYQDAYYFSRIFARYEGMAPSTFRSLSRRG
jgi:AraC-like DNA-binding protein